MLVYGKTIQLYLNCLNILTNDRKDNTKMESKQIQKEHWFQLQLATDDLDCADNTFCQETIEMKPNNFAIIVDGDSNDPIENINNIEARKPIQLLAYRIGKPIEPAGTITFEQERAAKKFKESLLDDGRLANKNQIFLHDNAHVTIVGKDLPNDINVSNSNLVLDKGTKVNGLKMGSNSDIHLKKGSKITNSSLYNTKTIAFDKNSIRTSSVPMFTNGAAKLVMHDSYLSDSEISNNSGVLSSRVLNANIIDSALNKSYVSFCNRRPESDLHDKNAVTIIKSNLSNSQIKVFSPEYRNDLIGMMIDNSSLEKTHIGTINSETTIRNSDLSHFTLVEPDISSNEITNSDISNLTLNNHALIFNSRILNKTKKPVYANQQILINAIKMQLNNGYSLKDTHRPIISMFKDFDIENNTIKSYPTYVEYGSYKYSNIKMMPINEKDNIFGNMFTDVDYDGEKLDFEVESFGINETSKFIDSAINHSLEASKTKQVDDGIEL